MNKRYTGIGEECGLIGIYTENSHEASRMIYYGLYSLQHRGQESCGIAINNSEKVTCYKDLGLVGDVFDDKRLSMLQGNIAIGHVRYSTTGSNTRENAQPLVVKYAKGTLTIAHNGNIANALELRTSLENEGAVFQTGSDTEVICYLIARERVKTPSVEEAIKRVIPMLKGSFSLLVMSPKKLIAVRDPYGIRPLCMGQTDDTTVFSSESCALDTLKARFIRDLRPGEIVVADRAFNIIHSHEDFCSPNDKRSALCIFEHIYFARPDSVIDKQSVYESRITAGRLLAKAHPVDADIVIAVPDSGIIAAIGYSRESGIPYGEGLIKNRYIGRTFIQPNQSMRETSILIKLNVLRHNIQDKRVVLVDDSIVRGTTIANLVRMIKNAGAKEVHVRISSPKFLWPCYFGTDVPDRDSLVCNIYTEDELCKKIGADSLGFLQLEHLPEIVKDSKLSCCDACFSGSYPFELPEHPQKSVFESQFSNHSPTKSGDSDD
ncbi:MAG: amidophosphoribosyltransferase [Clostridiales bacterium]|nr:amidophosphoribosyltransferase [Clostridiales bacterium]